MILRKPAIILAPIADCRSWRFRALESAVHPLVDAAQRLLARDCVGAELSLREWYAENVAANADEFFAPTAIGDSIASEPAWAVPLPWWDESVHDRRKQALRNARSEYERPDLQLNQVSEYWNVVGPVADEVVLQEVSRLERIISAPSGEVDHGGMPRVRGLIAPGESVKWEIKAGHHRMAVAAAKGLRFLRAQLMGFVRVEDAEDWAGVTQGNFAARSAQEVFFRVIRGVG